QNGFPPTFGSLLARSECLSIWCLPSLVVHAMLKNIACILLPPIALMSAAFAQDAQSNTIDCSAFSKRSDGRWYVGSPTTFDVGNTTSVSLAALSVGRNFMNVGGSDLFDLIEVKCGKDNSRPTMDQAQ
ncbi:hypothetical protein ABIF50_010433, partial [Bradyrhizobium diazoefficiens]